MEKYFHLEIAFKMVSWMVDIRSHAELNPAFRGILDRTPSQDPALPFAVTAPIENNRHALLINLCIRANRSKGRDAKLPV